MLTNADGAVDFKVRIAELGRTARAHWRDFIPHEAGRYILGLGATTDYLVRAERINALPRIVVRHKAGEEHTIAMAEEAYNLELVGGYEFDTPNQRFVYDSPTTPLQTYDYELAARTRVLRKTQEIPSGHDPAAYEAAYPECHLLNADVNADGAADNFDIDPFVELLTGP